MRAIVLRLRESLLTIPVGVVLVCVVAAISALYFDSRYSEILEEWPVVLSTTVAGGRGIATTVAGATITVSAIVYSITALSTQMASNQYSPRALGNFFEDTYQQVVIGLVVGTFTYSLVVLASLTNAIVDRSGTTPSVTVTLAAVLGVASVFGIVGYINHSLRRMQIDSVLQRISAAAVEAIESHLDIDPDANHFPIEMPTGPPQVVLARRGGWLTQIEVDQLIEALPDGATARVDVRLGEAISERDTLMTVWKNESLPLDDAALERALVSASREIEHARSHLRDSPAGGHRPQSAVPGSQRSHHRIRRPTPPEVSYPSGLGLRPTAPGLHRGRRQACAPGGDAEQG